RDVRRGHLLPAGGRCPGRPGPREASRAVRPGDRPSSRVAGVMALPIDPLIRLVGVSKIFHTEEVETHALSNIDLEIRAGEYVAIGGPSGCGKTTLLSLLGLLDSPSEGSYVLAGEPVAPLSRERPARGPRRRVALLVLAFHPAG